VALEAYKIDLSQWMALALQPVVKGEVFVPDESAADGQVVTVTAGANLLITDYVRLMVQGDLAFPGDGAPARWAPRNRLLVQMALRY